MPLRRPRRATGGRSLGDGEASCGLGLMVIVRIPPGAELREDGSLTLLESPLMPGEPEQGVFVVRGHPDARELVEVERTRGHLLRDRRRLVVAPPYPMQGGVVVVAVGVAERGDRASEALFEDETAGANFVFQTVPRQAL